MYSFTDEQRKHCGQLLMYFTMQSQHKYENGAKEHGSNLWDLSDDELIQNAYEEVIDLVMYLTTLVKNRQDRKNGV